MVRHSEISNFCFSRNTAFFKFKAERRSSFPPKPTTQPPLRSIPDTIGQEIHLLLRRTPFISIRAQNEHVNDFRALLLWVMVLFKCPPIRRNRTALETQFLAQDDVRPRAKEVKSLHHGIVIIILGLSIRQLFWAIALCKPDEPFVRDFISVVLDVRMICDRINCQLSWRTGEWEERRALPMFPLLLRTGSRDLKSRLERIQTDDG